MNQDVVRQSANVIAFIAVVVMNTLANVLPLAGRDTGAISARFPVLFTPAGYTFSIWGVIYLALSVFVIYQALPAHRTHPRLRRLGYLFVLSCVLNISWLFAWHHLLIALSLVIMIGLLVTLIMIYERLEIGKRPVDRAEMLAVRIPFSLYLGWITVATIANTTIAFYNLGWSPGGTAAALWAIVALIAAVGVGLRITLRRGDVPFNLVLVWAFVGIAVARVDTPFVMIAALVAATVILLALLYRQARPGAPQGQQLLKQ